MSTKLEKPVCDCPASTGIHDVLTFGSGPLDEHGFWSRPCKRCARWHEQQDNAPVGTYWPYPETKMPDNYELLRAALCDLLREFDVLSGECVGNSEDTVQSVLVSAIASAHELTHLLEEAYERPEAFQVFPSTTECLED